MKYLLYNQKWSFLRNLSNSWYFNLIISYLRSILFQISFLYLVNLHFLFFYNYSRLTFHLIIIKISIIRKIILINESKSRMIKIKMIINNYFNFFIIIQYLLIQRNHFFFWNRLNMRIMIIEKEMIKIW